MSGLYPGYYYPPAPAHPPNSSVAGPSSHAQQPGGPPHAPGALAHLISPASDSNTHSPDGSGLSSEAGPSSHANANGKRQLAPGDTAGEFKKMRAETDFEDEGQDQSYGEDGTSKSGKTKSTRGSR
jgi:hypothetical protein